MPHILIPEATANELAGLIDVYQDVDHIMAILRTPATTRELLDAAGGDSAGVADGYKAAIDDIAAGGDMDAELLADAAKRGRQRRKARGEARTSFPNDEAAIANAVKRVSLTDAMTPPGSGPFTLDPPPRFDDVYQDAVKRMDAEESAPMLERLVVEEADARATTIRFAAPPPPEVVCERCYRGDCVCGIHPSADERTTISLAIDIMREIRACRDALTRLEDACANELGVADSENDCQ